MHVAKEKWGYLSNLITSFNFPSTLAVAGNNPDCGPPLHSRIIRILLREKEEAE